MKKLTGRYTLAAMIGLTLLFGGILASTTGAAAQTDAAFNVNSSMADNLAALKGKSVTLHLASGQTLTGVVNDVKGNLLHLVKISQREFFDALVAIDRISAVETKVR